MRYADPRQWAALMGRDLDKSDLQPIEPMNDGADLRIDGHEGGRTLTLVIQEHLPDVLGPRFLDELRGDLVVRHAIPGPARDEWTADRMGELEELLCAQPFRLDPVAAIAGGDSWVAWMTRNRILQRPDAGDEALRIRLVEGILRQQDDDGSWEDVPGTAYAILNLLSLGLMPSDAPIRSGAEWLLRLPEPAPRPGMWMLSQEALNDWVSKRQPQEKCSFAPGEFHWVPLDEDTNYYSWRFPDAVQDQFRGQEMQQVIPTCARHHPPACEPRMVHVSGVVAEALLRCGYSDHPRLRRYVNTLYHLGGEWGYWCGCGALGLYDSDIPASDKSPDLDVRGLHGDGQADLARWRWTEDVMACALLANQPDLPAQGTHLEPFDWHVIPGQEGVFALIGSGWQNGDCWVKTNRALAQHPSCTGSLTELQAIYQASRYQTSLGEWSQGFPAGMLALLSEYDHVTARVLVTKTVPWLRRHQEDDGLWHQESLPRDDWGKPAQPAGPKLATYHIVSALKRFGLLDCLRP